MKINPSPKTPAILLDDSAFVFEIKGVSCPENPVLFYNPIIDALNSYFSKNDRINLTIHLDYFNTGSSKCLLNILNLIAEKTPVKGNSNVTWITEEEDIELVEAGKIFQEMSGLDFNFETDPATD